MNTARHYAERAQSMAETLSTDDLERLFVECQAEALRHAADKAVDLIDTAILTGQLRNEADAILRGTGDNADKK